MDIIFVLLIAAGALALGGVCGYLVFRYVLKGKYNEMIDTATKQADVIKEKKLLEVKEKFINKKSELEKEVQQRNQHIQQSENKLKQREISLNQRQEELSTISSNASRTRRSCCQLRLKSWRRCSLRSARSLRKYQV